jgi:hypothetical protein
VDVVESGFEGEEVFYHAGVPGRVVDNGETRFLTYTKFSRFEATSYTSGQDKNSPYPNVLDQGNSNLIYGLHSRKQIIQPGQVIHSVLDHQFVES